MSVKKSKLAPVPLIAPFPVIFPIVVNLLYASSDDEIGPIEVTEPVFTPSSVSSDTSGTDVTRLVFISPAPAPVPPPTPPEPVCSVATGAPTTTGNAPATKPSPPSQVTTIGLPATVKGDPPTPPAVTGIPPIPPTITGSPSSVMIC